MATEMLKTPNCNTPQFLISFNASFQVLRWNHLDLLPDLTSQNL